MNRHIKCIISFVVAAMLIISSSLITALADNGIYISMPENPELISKNPGKGWIRYGVQNTAEDAVLSQKALDYAGIAYMRFQWSHFQPDGRGQFDWSYLDNTLNYWEERGIPFAFRIMTFGALTRESMVPQWVYDAGVPYMTLDATTTFVGQDTDFTVTVPDWRHPLYLELYEEFLAALAERYDGDPRIFYMDIGGYGTDGEYMVQHLRQSHHPESIAEDGYFAYAYTTEEMQYLIDMHCKYFKKTQLVCPAGVWSEPGPGNNRGGVSMEKAAEMNIALRNDFGYTALEEAAKLHFNQRPTIDEMGPTYDNRIAQYGPWNNLHYLNYVKFHRMSYLTLGGWSDDTEHFIRDEEGVIRYLTNKMGYHLVVNGASMPATASANSNFDITFDWTNKGLESLLLDCVEEVALLDKNDNVIKTYRSPNTPTKTYLPDMVFKDTVSVTLDNVANGDYRLAVGIIRDDVKVSYDGKPDVMIGNYGMTKDKWYVFANAKKQGSQFSFSPYIHEIDINGKDVYAETYTEGNTTWIPIEEVIEPMSIEYSVSGDGVVTSMIDTTTLSVDKANRQVTISGIAYGADSIKTIGTKQYMTLDVLRAIPSVNVELKGENIFITTSLYAPRENRYEKISNPGFELDNNAWSYDTEKFYITTKDKFEGERSMAFNAGMGGTLHQTIGMDFNTLYHASFKVNSETPITYKVYDAAGKEAVTGVTEPTGGKWQEYKIPLDCFDPGEIILGDPMMEEAKVKMVIEVGENTTGGFIDDFKLTKVSTYDELLDEDNLIADYGAEISMVNSWTQRSNSGISRTTDNPGEGLVCFKLTPSHTWGGAEYNWTDKLKEGGPGKYALEALIRTDEGITVEYVSFYGLYYGSGKVEGWGKLENDVTDQWKRYRIEFDVTQEVCDYIFENNINAVSLLGFGNHITDENGNFIHLYFDDFSLRRIN